MSVIEEKKALRTYIRQTERTLDPAYKAESSEAICRCVLALEEYRAAGTVFAFAGTVHEIDTSLLLKETLAAGKTLVLPRCAEGHALDLCVVTFGQSPSLHPPGVGLLHGVHLLCGV